MTKTLELITDGLNDAQKKAVSNPLDVCTKIVAGFIGKPANCFSTLIRFNVLQEDETR